MVEKALSMVECALAVSFNHTRSRQPTRSHGFTYNKWIVLPQQALVAVITKYMLPNVCSYSEQRRTFSARMLLKNMLFHAPALMPSYYQSYCLPHIQLYQ